MNVLVSLIRRPEAAAGLSLTGVILFYVIFGGVDLTKLLGAASWINFAANLGIVAIPIGLLMIAGELDISIGAMIPAGSMTTAVLSGYYELPIVVGMLGAVGMGVIVGTINGLLTVRTSVPSLIITLGTLVAMQGVILAGAKLLTGAASVPLKAPDWAKTESNGSQPSTSSAPRISFACCAIAFLSPSVIAVLPKRNDSEIPASAVGTAKSSLRASVKEALITGVGSAPRISTERCKNDSIRRNAVADSSRAPIENSSIER